MEFSPDSDYEVLEELFGNDAKGLNESVFPLLIVGRVPQATCFPSGASSNA